MTRSSLILVGVLTLVSAEVVSAHPRGGRGAGFAGAISINRAGGSGNFNAGVAFYRSPAVPYRDCRPNYYWPNYRTWYPAYSYYPTYYPSYVPTYYGTGYQPATSVVVAREPKPVVNVAVIPHDDNSLEDIAMSKFCFKRGLDQKANRVEMEIIARDRHSDTNALKKVKFEVHWVEIKVVKAKDGTETREEKLKRDTIKLKFDEHGQFTEYCD